MPAFLPAEKNFPAQKAGMTYNLRITQPLWAHTFNRQLKKNNNFKALYLIDKLLLYWKKGNIRDKILNSADYPQILLNEF